MYQRRHSALALVTTVGLALGSVACGESNDDSDDMTEDESCNAEFNGPIDPAALIDDLEDGDGQIAQVGARNGSWWISTDGTDGVVTPEANMAPPAERILGKRCDSELGMRVTGADFSAWGAVLSLGFRYTDKEEPIDISEYEGVMLWARVGETHSSNVRIQLQDSTTHIEGGKCNAEDGNPDSCWDGWGTDLEPLGTEWQLYKIDFSKLTQRDFGLQGDALDLENVYNIDFSLDANAVFDLWLDDLWLYE
jgi:hypothetical protein